MLSLTSRSMGGITRVASISKGGRLERHNLTQSLSLDAVDLRKHSRDTHVVGFSRESDFPQLQMFNPDIFKGVLDPVMVDGTVPLIPEVHLENVQRRSTPVSHIDPFLLARSRPKSSSALHHTRGFRTSPHVPYDSTSYGMTDVPDFLVKYKQHRATALVDSEAHGREYEEFGLMESLTYSTPSGNSARRVEAKTPVEHHVGKGHIIHPSGFVVPGPGHSSTSDVARAKEKERNESIDRATQTAAVADCVLESNFEHVDATTHPSSHKVPFEARELDGTVKHLSGFVPPTPAREFRYPVDTLRVHMHFAKKRQASAA